MGIVFLFASLLSMSSSSLALCLPDTRGEEEIQGRVIKELEIIADDVAASFPEVLIVFQATDPRINAEIRRTNEGLILELFGGMLGHSKMSPEAFKLLLCHEIGHALGGPPLKARGGWSSTEGQADYYSGKVCARSLAMNETEVIDGSIALTTIYAEVMGGPLPKLDVCEPKVVERTNYGYPSPQCRLQTILAGWKEGARPRCWFKD